MVHVCEQYVVVNPVYNEGAENTWNMKDKNACMEVNQSNSFNLRLVIYK